MEEEVKYTEPVSEEEFTKRLIDRNTLMTFEGVRVFKSLRRAIRRGQVLSNGVIAPTRPFHNKANTSSRKGVHSRKFNEEKKKIYARIKGRI